MNNDCIGCGYCCTSAQCVLSLDVHGEKPLCPELVFLRGRHWCLWVIKQELVGEEEGLKAAEQLSIGAGCSSGLNSWRREKIVDRTKPEPNLFKAPDFMAAILSQIGGSAYPSYPWKRRP